MSLKLVVLGETGLNCFKHCPFFISETVWIGRIYGREILIVKLMLSIPKHYCSLLIIDLVKKKPVLQFVFRVSHYSLSFNLELAYGYCLVHSCHKLLVHRIVFVCFYCLRPECCTRVIGINLLCHGCQRSQVNSVSHLHHVKVVVFDVYSQHIGNACPASRCRTHPENVVIAPLEINIVIVHEIIHNLVGSSTSVPNVSYYMESVNSQTADNICHLNDEILSFSALNQGVNNLHIVFTHVVLRIGMEQFIDDVCILLGKSLADLGLGVLVGYGSQNLSELNDCSLAPLFEIILALLAAGQLCLCIIYQSSQRIPLLIGKSRPENVINLVPNYP